MKSMAWLLPIFLGGCFIHAGERSDEWVTIEYTNLEGTRSRMEMFWCLAQLQNQYRHDEMWPVTRGYVWFLGKTVNADTDPESAPYAPSVGCCLVTGNLLALPCVAVDLCLSPVKIIYGALTVSLSEPGVGGWRQRGDPPVDVR